MNMFDFLIFDINVGMKRELVSGFIMLIVISFNSYGQDNHYWYMKYGGEASGMGGAVIAGTRDNSAVFYNPGALGFIDDLSISVNATVYMAQLSRIFNGAGDGLTLKQWRYTYFPQMLSGMLPFKKLERWRFGYTLMSRYNSYYRFNILETAKYDVIESIDGEESFVGTYEYFNDINEQWGGLGASYRVSDIFSLGLTAFASYRNQFYQQVYNARTVPVQDTNYFLVSLGDYDNIRYIHWKLIIKLGFALDLEKWKIGLSMTMPSIAIYGDADVQREINLTNFNRINPELASGDLLAIDRQTFLPMHNRSPLSIAIGIRHQGDKTSIEIDGEYFFGIKPYKMIDAEGQPFIYPPELVPEDIQEEYDFLAVYNYANPVLNAGIGLKHHFSEKVDMLCGFHTDFNFKRYEEEADGYLISSGSWNLYHFTGGIAYKMKSSLISLGLNYYFGIENDIPQLLSFSAPKDYLGLSGEITEDAYVRVHGLAGVISFTYFFQQKQDLPF